MDEYCALYVILEITEVGEQESQIFPFHDSIYW